jgi:hypothetical protein
LSMLNEPMNSDAFTFHKPFLRSAGPCPCLCDCFIGNDEWLISWSVMNIPDFSRKIQARSDGKWLRSHSIETYFLLSAYQTTPRLCNSFDEHGTNCLIRVLSHPGQLLHDQRTLCRRQYGWLPRTVITRLIAWAIFSTVNRYLKREIATIVAGNRIALNR